MGYDNTLSRARAVYRSPRRRRFRVAGLSACALLASVAVFAPLLPARAAGTPTTGLFMPQGGGALITNGDYVSSSTALATTYRYFVEVPPGQTRLVVDIFDADVGIGGAAEATAGRDRLRTAFDTAVTYRLFNPAGAARTVAFTTGDATLPASSDGAWLSLFDHTGDRVRDLFETTAYTNNDGTVTWNTNWTETDDDGVATSGLIRVVAAGEMRIRDDGAGGASTITREANLTANGFSTAELRFDLRTANVEAGDQMRVEVSNNGGGAWTTLETFTGTFATTTRTYDITSFIATNTQVRFVQVTGYTGNDSFFVDNLEIRETTVDAGHWEVQVDHSGSAGDDINAFGIRAHDGTSGAGGTEYPVYWDSHSAFGANVDLTRTYSVYPWVTAGCTMYENDFDYDSATTPSGSVALTSRTGAFSQTVPLASLSGDNVWARTSATGWASDATGTEYGIWPTTINFATPAGAGNYANFYFTNYAATTAIPAANPTTNAFRVYLPADDGSAPVKPYLEQFVRYHDGPNPPVSLQTSVETVTVRITNPAAFAITFSGSNTVIANVPGTFVTYNTALTQVSQGSIVSQPSDGGSGNVVWNPGTLASGASAILAYRVNVTPTSAGQRVSVTATPASGSGTRAQYVDETGNTAQARATAAVGPLCDVAVTEGLLTEARVTAFEARDDVDGVVLEWQTAAEARSVGFDVMRADADGGVARVNPDVVLGAVAAPQGGAYRLLDPARTLADGAAYYLVEIDARGGRNVHGPYRPKATPTRRARVDLGRLSMRHAPAWRRNAGLVSRSLVDASAASPALAPDGLHLTVREAGLYYLSPSDLAPLFGGSSAVAAAGARAGSLALTHRGRPVAWFRRPDSAGVYFYAEPEHSLFADDDAYRVVRRVGVQSRVADARRAPVFARPSASFQTTTSFAEDAFAATVVATDPDADYWYWKVLAANDPTVGRVALPFDARGLAATAATASGGRIALKLQGASTTGIANEHDVSVALNGVPIGHAAWSGIARHEASFALPPGALRDAGNRLELEATRAPNVTHSIVYVDGFDVTYPRRFVADADTLAFATTPGQIVHIDGFSSGDIDVLDVTRPEAPIRVRGAKVAADRGTFRVAFRAGDLPARYVASARGALKSPLAIRPWSAPTLRAPSMGAQYVVVTDDALAPTAETLATYRRGQGLSSRVITLSEIADTFAHGVATPHAIRELLAHATARWQTRPLYVVLAGGGTLDYRNRLGHGDSLVPPLLTATPSGLFASDARFADVNDDGIAELAIGRIPVLTPDELGAYIRKLATFENETGPWNGRVITVADATDRSARFADVSDGIAERLRGSFDVTRIELGPTALDVARDDLFARLRDGAAFVNYTGHGGLDRLSRDGLLTVADVPSLASVDHVGVLTAMSCSANRFEVPGVASLGEQLVRSAGGAVAVWAPTGLSLHGEARALAAQFYQRANDGALGARLGDRILATLDGYRTAGGATTMMHIYALLGDPALRMVAAPPLAAAAPLPATANAGE